jgi:hypothetical protein
MAFIPLIFASSILIFPATRRSLQLSRVQAVSNSSRRAWFLLWYTLSYYLLCVFSPVVSTAGVAENMSSALYPGHTTRTENREVRQVLAHTERRLFLHRPSTDHLVRQFNAFYFGGTRFLRCRRCADRRQMETILIPTFPQHRVYERDAC